MPEVRSGAGSESVKGKERYRRDCEGDLHKVVRLRGCDGFVVRWTSACTGCTEVPENTSSPERGIGCHECGYTGKQCPVCNHPEHDGRVCHQDGDPPATFTCGCDGPAVGGMIPEGPLRHEPDPRETVKPPKEWPCDHVFRSKACGADGSGGDSCDKTREMCRDVHRNEGRFSGGRFAGYRIARSRNGKTLEDEMREKFGKLAFKASLEGTADAEGWGMLWGSLSEESRECWRRIGWAVRMHYDERVFSNCGGGTFLERPRG